MRAVQTRSERLKDAVSAAYAAKYNTPASKKYVRDLSGREVARDDDGAGAAEEASKTS